MQRNTYNSLLALVINTILFGLKTGGWIYSHSIALLSDAVNSFSDIIATVALLVSVRISNKKADTTHPFGHGRAEPVGALIVAIVACLLGIEIIKEAILSLIHPKELFVNAWIFAIVGFTIVSKTALFLYFQASNRVQSSTSTRALAVDSINDVMVGFGLIINFLFIEWGIPYMDGILGIGIGLWITKNGFSIGLENMDFLMGKRPPDHLIEKINGTIDGIDGVQKVNHVLAHYVGPNIHVEVHISINSRQSLREAHDMGELVRRSLEQYSEIERAFIHIDPV